MFRTNFAPSEMFSRVLNSSFLLKRHRGGGCGGCCLLISLKLNNQITDSFMAGGGPLCFLFLQETCKCLKSNGNLLAVFMGGQAVISHKKCLQCRQQLYCCTNAMLKLSSAPLIYGLREHFLGFLDSVDSFKSD